MQFNHQRAVRKKHASAAFLFFILLPTPDDFTLKGKVLDLTNIPQA